MKESSACLILALICHALTSPLRGQSPEWERYTPEDEVWNPALLRRAHDSMPREWTSTEGKSFSGVLVRADETNAIILAGKKRFVVPVTAFRQQDGEFIQEAREKWNAAGHWFRASGDAWRTDPGLLMKSLATATKETPGLLAPAKAVTPIEAGTIGISLQDPPPPGLLTLVRPLFGEKILFPMSFEALKKNEVVFAQAKGLSGVIDSIVSDHARVVSAIRPNLVCDLEFTCTERGRNDWRSVKRGTATGCAGVISGLLFGAITYRGIDFPFVVLKVSDARPMAGPPGGSLASAPLLIAESFEAMTPGIVTSLGEWTTRYLADEPDKAEWKAEAGNTYLAMPRSILRHSSVTWRLFAGKEAPTLGSYSKVRWGGRFRCAPATSNASVRVQVEGLNKQWDLEGFTIKGFNSDQRWLEFRSDWAPIDRSAEARVWFSFPSPYPGAYHVDDLFVELQ